MTDEIIVTSTNDVKFIQGVTKMNQENWMKYFKYLLSNGVLKGLYRHNYPNDTFDGLYPGAVATEGLISEITSDDLDSYGKIRITRPTVEQGFNDIFICARVYLHEGTAELVIKNLSDTYNLQTIAGTESRLILNESYGCVRNEEIYEMPLWYGSQIFADDMESQYKTWWNGRDLRRYGKTYLYEDINNSHKQGYVTPIRLSNSQSTYSINSLRYTDITSITTQTINIAIDPMNPPELCTLTFSGNYTYNYSINFLKQYWQIGNYKSLTAVSINAPSGWEDQNVYLNWSGSATVSVPAKSKTIAKNDTTKRTFTLKLSSNYTNNYVVYYTYNLTEE